MTLPAESGSMEWLLLAALALAGLVFWRLHRRQLAAPIAAAPGAPAGSVILPLGQYAVAPDRQWLLLPAGH